MRFRRGLLATALAASLSIVWTQEAQASVVTVIPVSQWAYANSRNINNSSINDTFIAAGDPSPGALIMRVGNDTTGNLYRGFIRFSLTGITGQVLDVRLLGRVDHTWSCSPRPTSFYRTAAITVTPRQSWPGPALLTPLGTEFANANESVCAQPNMLIELATVQLQTDVQALVSAGQPALYVGISARDLVGGTNEAAADRWMRYFLNDFRLHIAYEPA